MTGLWNQISVHYFLCIGNQRLKLTITGFNKKECNYNRKELMDVVRNIV